jgi:hypothetical protein
MKTLKCSSSSIHVFASSVLNCPVAMHTSRPKESIEIKIWHAECRFQTIKINVLFLCAYVECQKNWIIFYHCIPFVSCSIFRTLVQCQIVNCWYAEIDHEEFRLLRSDNIYSCLRRLEWFRPDEHSCLHRILSCACPMAMVLEAFQKWSKTFFQTFFACYFSLWPSLLKIGGTSTNLDIFRNAVPRTVTKRTD